MTGRTATAACTLVLLAACSVTQAERTTTTTVATTGPTPVTLTADGLDPYPVGEPAAGVVAGLTELYGGPDQETPWEAAASSRFGTCPGDEVRGLAWGTLYVIEQRSAGGEVFLTWTYGFDHERAETGDPRQLGLRTAEGIGLGATRAEMEEVYGSRLDVVVDTDSGTTGFTVDGAQPQHLRGRLSGGDDDARVEYLERAPGCT